MPKGHDEIKSGTDDVLFITPSSTGRRLAALKAARMLTRGSGNADGQFGVFVARERRVLIDSSTYLAVKHPRNPENCVKREREEQGRAASSIEPPKRSGYYCDGCEKYRADDPQASTCGWWKQWRKRSGLWGMTVAQMSSRAFRQGPRPDFVLFDGVPTPFGIVVFSRRDMEEGRVSGSAASGVRDAMRLVGNKLAAWTGERRRVVGPGAAFALRLDKEDRDALSAAVAALGDGEARGPWGLDRLFDAILAGATKRSCPLWLSRDDDGVKRVGVLLRPYLPTDGSRIIGLADACEPALFAKLVGRTSIRALRIPADVGATVDQRPGADVTQWTLRREAERWLPLVLSAVDRLLQQDAKPPVLVVTVEAFATLLRAELRKKRRHDVAVRHYRTVVGGDEPTRYDAAVLVGFPRISRDDAYLQAAALWPWKQDLPARWTRSWRPYRTRPGPDGTYPGRGVGAAVDWRVQAVHELQGDAVLYEALTTAGGLDENNIMQQLAPRRVSLLTGVPLPPEVAVPVKLQPDDDSETRAEQVQDIADSCLHEHGWVSLRMLMALCAPDEDGEDIHGYLIPGDPFKLDGLVLPSKTIRRHWPDYIAANVSHFGVSVGIPGVRGRRPSDSVVGSLENWLRGQQQIVADDKLEVRVNGVRIDDDLLGVAWDDAPPTSVLRSPVAEPSPPVERPKPVRAASTSGEPTPVVKPSPVADVDLDELFDDILES